MKILIWTGHHDPLDTAIKFLTHGQGSHAAFLRADGKTIHEAFYPRVRDRLMTKRDIGNFTAFELENLRPHHHDMFERVFDANLKKGIRYSIIDLFRYAINRPNRDEKHTFCSRYVVHCCQQVLPERLQPLTRLPAKDWASPRDLRISPRLHPVALKFC